MGKENQREGVVICCVKILGGKSVKIFSLLETPICEYKKANRSSYNNIESFGFESDVSIYVYVRYSYTEIG